MRSSKGERWNDQGHIDQLKHVPLHSGLRIFDVDVTEDDCERADPGHPTRCAIAVAVRRLIPNASFVCVRKDGVTVTVEKRYLHFAPGRKSSEFIERFDQLMRPEPTRLQYELSKVRDVPQYSEERKQQINEARRRRAAAGRPDKVYLEAGSRLRTAKSAKARERGAIRAAIEKAKREAA